MATKFKNVPFGTEVPTIDDKNIDLSGFTVSGGLTVSGDISTGGKVTAVGLFATELGTYYNGTTAYPVLSFYGDQPTLVDGPWAGFHVKSIVDVAGHVTFDADCGSLVIEDSFDWPISDGGCAGLWMKDKDGSAFSVLRAIGGSGALRDPSGQSCEFKVLQNLTFFGGYDGNNYSSDGYVVSGDVRLAGGPGSSQTASLHVGNCPVGGDGYGHGAAGVSIGSDCGGAWPLARFMLDDFKAEYTHDCGSGEQTYMSENGGAMPTISFNATSYPSATYFGHFQVSDKTVSGDVYRWARFSNYGDLQFSWCGAPSPNVPDFVIGGYKPGSGTYGTEGTPAANASILIGPVDGGNGVESGITFFDSSRDEYKTLWYESVRDLMDHRVNCGKSIGFYDYGAETKSASVTLTQDVDGDYAIALKLSGGPSGVRVESPSTGAVTLKVGETTLRITEKVLKALKTNIGA